MDKLQLHTSNPAAYLAATEIADFNAANVSALAQKLVALHGEPSDFARAAFTFVRDNIRHSADIAQPLAVTCKASAVLAHGEGICFAKSHLLAALLRFYAIPCGFCYQILRQGAGSDKFCLHGLNAVFMNGRWSRLDARGNKPGVNAQFNLDEEQLAYCADSAKGERDLAVIFAEPAATVVRAFAKSASFTELWANLPANV